MSHRKTRETTAASGWDLEVTVRREGPGPVLRIDGDLDLGCAPLVTAMVDHAAAVYGRPVAVDLTGVAYADTHGLAPLLRAGVVIRRTSPQVQRLLRLLGLAVGAGPSRPVPVPVPSGGRDRSPRARPHRRRPALRPALPR
ncbi:anti-anti-sigma factor [Geodermatophilus dictyosporus]|uniref:Anti-anti-sigma factor n=1 Tax=Geodermatophilus dictyosporus TaxID=1523247 RepID=A0A1I5JTF8_9ACTN|nr:STAS domain-containing protein [Geodermatophilus dictyosporus]SFO76035.1 anti-anti-sigma factor [Geodermatophilus dictyosporus]